MTSPTPYPEVNELAAAILEGARHILGDDFVGMYLVGSLATGDYVPGRSDVDFLVVTERPPDEAQTAQLAAVHHDIAEKRSDPLPLVEGSYFPRTSLRRHEPDDIEQLALRVEGHFGPWPHGLNWVMQRQTIRDHAIALAGPPARELIDPVTPEEIRAANRQGNRSFWPEALDDRSMLPGREYLVFAVLTMARVLHTDATGRLAGKDEAAAWTATQHPQWADLLAEAREWRYGRDFDHRPETMDLVRFTLDRLGSG